MNLNKHRIEGRNSVQVEGRKLQAKEITWGKAQYSDTGIDVGVTESYGAWKDRKYCLVLWMVLPDSNRLKQKESFLANIIEQPKGKWLQTYGLVLGLRRCLQDQISLCISKLHLFWVDFSDCPLVVKYSNNNSSYSSKKHMSLPQKSQQKSVVLHWLCLNQFMSQSLWASVWAAVVCLMGGSTQMDWSNWSRMSRK